MTTSGAVVGWLNLIAHDVGCHRGTGHRVAESVAGRGVATTAVGQVCRQAASTYDLRLLRAKVADSHVASQKVLLHTGFRAAGPADVAGRPGTWFERQLHG